MTERRIGTHEEWQAARDELLRLEKEHTRMGDDLARKRRELPWVLVEKEYRFDTGDGTRTLAELFDGRSQLLVYHFMFGPSYEAGCPTCSSSADAVNAVLSHLHARDVDDALRLTGADRAAARLRGTDGLELPVGVVREHRLQLRPRVLVHGRAGARVRRADARRGRSLRRRVQRGRQRDRHPRLPHGGTGLQRVHRGRRCCCTTRTRPKLGASSS